MSKQSEAIKFIRLWMNTRRSGGGIEDIARVLNVTRQAVEFKATRYRAWGVNLPRLQNNVSNPYDIKSLNKMIKEFA